ncbi:hypothetical protein [Streptomyces bottropensis]|uniref:hypothetical protein n=1 Tax=Streptomyces bottropensis TaxID=42235 RepID=UPI0036901BF0
MTADPKKHLLGYGRQDPLTGTLHGHIRYPAGTAPTPYGCRWCGTEQGGHGRRWIPGKGMHAWERPTEAQIKARMLARRAARLNRKPARYHAETGWAADQTGESGDPYCWDCASDGCRKWMRIQDRLNQQRWGFPRRIRVRRKASHLIGGWGGDAPWPF